ncbi:MAG TPA: M48 family peptidase [Phaeodactylibacter sp.]|nr:M48 family peptidase [Phaeodactylibacter sp.]
MAKRRGGRPRAKQIYHGHFSVPGGGRVKMKIYLEYRNNIRYSAGSTGLLVRLPVATGPKAMEEHIEKAKAWYISSLEQNERLRKEVLPDGFEDGQELHILGEKWRIRLEDAPRFASYHTIRALDDEKTLLISLVPALPEAERNKVAKRMAYKLMADYFLLPVWQRVEELRDKHFPGQLFRKVSLRNTKRQWGSCSVGGNISLSIRLLFAPKEVLDYVIIHELAHLIEQNHSDRFWALVEKAMPDYLEKVKWLKEQGRSLSL